MNKDENTEVKLFGFKINNTVAVILVFFAIPISMGFFNQIYLTIYSLIQMIGSPVGDIFSLIIYQQLINILIIIISVSIYAYILITCSKTKKLERETEDTQMKWFGFNLTNTSLITIGILSILGIITSITLIISQIYYILFMVSLLHGFNIQVFNNVLNAIISLVLMLIYIYTVIVCRKANSI